MEQRTMSAAGDDGRLTVFIAGATGVIGRRLVRMLAQAGHEVHGCTRSTANARIIEAQGGRPWVVDVFDASALAEVLQQISPQAVVHQLTDLPEANGSGIRSADLLKNARIRREGTRNLVVGARAAGCGYVVAQSIAWAYASHEGPCDETCELDLMADGDRAVTVGGVVALEATVLHGSGMNGAVLRYGLFHGPGTGRELPGGPTPVHVDAAAHAAVLAVQHRACGVFNICEPNAFVSARKAETELGWSPSFRLRP